MSLSVETHRSRGACVVVLRGAATLGPGLVSLSAQARLPIEQGAKAIVLDVSAVTTIDSAGLGEIVRIYSRASRHGIPLVIAGPGARFRELLTITHLDRLLPAYLDEHAALESVAGKGSQS